MLDIEYRQDDNISMEQKKRGRGKPSKGADAITKKISLSVSQRQLDKIEALARKADYKGSINVFTRDILINALDKVSSAGAADIYKRSGDNES